jgi:hypothetical protein
MNYNSDIIADSAAYFVQLGLIRTDNLTTATTISEILQATKEMLATEVTHRNRLLEASQWLTNYAGFGEYCVAHDVFYFTDDRDATWFALCWGGTTR